jgi:RecB family endonuclease NucS
LLAVDQEGKYVVIELKLSQGRNKTLGQLLYYMGWVDQHMGGAPCRGFIIASDITEELSIAVARVPGVSLPSIR